MRVSVRDVLMTPAFVDRRAVLREAAPSPPWLRPNCFVRPLPIALGPHGPDPG